MKNQTEGVNPETFNGAVLDYLETANDFIKYEAEKGVSVKGNSIYQYSNVKQNDHWIQEWMEQTSTFNIGYENNCSFDNNDFCCYVDVK